MSYESKDDKGEGDEFLMALGKDAFRAALIATISVLVSALSGVITDRRRGSNYSSDDDFNDY